MPPPVLPRDVLPNEPMRGVGGFVSFQWKESLSDVINRHGGERLHIKEWSIEHTYTNVEIPAAGNYGSMTIRRVADGFRFIIALDLDLRPPRDNGIGPGPNNQPHMDGRLGGPRVQGGTSGSSNPSAASQPLIGIKFQVGDPSFWAEPGITLPIATDNKGVYYWCPDVMIAKVTTTNPVRVPGVVACVVEGHGSSPLQRYVDEVWCGAGAFGFTDKAIGGP